jgi:hypothetical protein
LGLSVARLDTSTPACSAPPGSVVWETSEHAHDRVAQSLIAEGSKERTEHIEDSAVGADQPHAGEGGGDSVIPTIGALRGTHGL